MTLDAATLEDIAGTCMPFTHENKGMVYVGNYVDKEGGKIGHTECKPYYRRPSSQGLEVVGFIPGSRGAYGTEAKIQAVARSMGKTQLRNSNDTRWRDEFEETFSEEDFTFLESKVPMIRKQEEWDHIRRVLQYVHSRICGALNDPRWERLVGQQELAQERRRRDGDDARREDAVREAHKILGVPYNSDDFWNFQHAAALDMMLHMSESHDLEALAAEWKAYRGRS